MSAQSGETPQDIVAAAESVPAEWCARVAGTNISATTLLATDYLNHYNEAVMIIEMAPEMPDLLEEIADWQPVDYAAHFAESGFADRELAVAAYDYVPAAFKTSFEETVRKLDEMVLYALETLTQSRANDDPENLKAKCRVFTEVLKTLVQTASGIINGKAQTVGEAEINRILSSG